MTYLLDTNACITHLRSKGKSKLSQRLRSISSADVTICSVVRAELRWGAMRSQNPVKNLAAVDAFVAPFMSLPFDGGAADIHAQVRADLAARGVLIGPHDLLIAAIAMAKT